MHWVVVRWPDRWARSEDLIPDHLCTSPQPWADLTILAENGSRQHANNQRSQPLRYHTAFRAAWGPPAHCKREGQHSMTPYAAVSVHIHARGHQSPRARLPSWTPCTSRRPHYAGVVRSMADLAERHAVTHGNDAVTVGVRHTVRSIEKLRMPYLADCTACPVSPHDHPAESSYGRFAPGARYVVITESAAAISRGL